MIELPEEGLLLWIINAPIFISNKDYFCSFINLTKSQATRKGFSHSQ